MAWARLQAEAMTHPKILTLDDRAFRLWIWSLTYCQLHLTDGLVTRDAIPRRLLKSISELLDRRLWDQAADGELWVHDYLEWNESRETIRRKREGTRRRVSEHRAHQDLEGSNALPQRVTPRTVGVGSTSDQKNENVLAREASASLDEGLAQRAGRFIEQYQALYQQLRGGAHLHLRPALDFQKAKDICRTWADDAHLEQLARVILTTDEPFIAQSDRGIGIFAARATWADDRLAQVRRERR